MKNLLIFTAIFMIFFPLSAQAQNVNSELEVKWDKTTPGTPFASVKFEDHAFLVSSAPNGFTISSFDRNGNNKWNSNFNQETYRDLIVRDGKLLLMSVAGQNPLDGVDRFFLKKLNPATGHVTNDHTFTNENYESVVPGDDLFIPLRLLLDSDNNLHVFGFSPYNSEGQMLRLTNHKKYIFSLGGNYWPTSVVSNNDNFIIGAHDNDAQKGVVLSFGKEGGLNWISGSVCDCVPKDVVVSDGKIFVIANNNDKEGDAVIVFSEQGMNLSERYFSAEFRNVTVSNDFFIVGSKDNKATIWQSNQSGDLNEIFSLAELNAFMSGKTMQVFQDWYFMAGIKETVSGADNFVVGIEESGSQDTTGTNIEAHQAEIDINLYPNPSRNYFVIDGVSGQSIKVFNLKGRKVFSAEIENNLPIKHNLSDGIYIYWIGQHSGRLVVE